MAVLNSVDKFYRAIIEEVLLECRELFLDDEVDEAVLAELKQMWERKIKQAKVFEFSNLKPANNSFNIGSYGIISSSRNVGCPEILVPSIHLTGPRGDGSNPCTPTATIALPYGLYQQQISALNNAGISLQPSGNGQFLAFLRPDQPRLQSLTVPQNRQASGKGISIAVSTPSVAPVRPELANLNSNTAKQPNRVPTTSVPTKTVPELNKQKILPAQGAVNNGPNGNIAVKVTKSTCSQPSLNINNNNNGGGSVTNETNNHNGSNVTASCNTKIAGTANSTINISNHSKDNTMPYNIKNIPNNSNTNPNSLNTGGALLSYTNNKTNSNSVINNTATTAVTTNTTLASFNTAQNTQPPLNTSSTNTNCSHNTQMYNNGVYYNNQPPGPQLNNYESQPDNNNSYSGVYDDSVYRTGVAFGVTKQPESLDDYMDNLYGSNNGAPYGYVNPQPSHISADRNVITDFDSAVNAIGSLVTNYSAPSDSYNNNTSLFGQPSTSNYRRDPLDGEGMHGQTSRFSEEDMQTIEEILQLDGAGDEYEFRKGPKSTLRQQAMIRRFSSETRQPDVKNLIAYKITSPQICKAKYASVSQNTNANKNGSFNDGNYLSGKQFSFERLKMRNILKGHSLREDTVLNKPNHSIKDMFALSMFADTSVLDFNSTLNKDDKNYKLETEIQVFGSLFKNKTPHFRARCVSKPTPTFALNRFENLSGVTKDKHLEISPGFLPPDLNSSTNSVCDLRQSVLTTKDVPPMRNQGFSKSQTIVSKKTKAMGTCKETGPFLRASIHYQFDGEDDDSSSSSDDNINANDAPSDDEDDEDDDNECEEATEEAEDSAIESEPLNSADDDSDIDICAMFESDNIVVCQFEKISRNKNKWKFHLKDGIMNLYGRDLIFSKSVGEAEW